MILEVQHETRLQYSEPISEWLTEVRMDVSGPEGLRDYLRREGSKFHQTVSVKLLGYALGRGGIVSDRPLIERMTDGLARGDRFGDLVVRVVTSEQFRNQRSQ